MGLEIYREEYKTNRYVVVKNTLDKETLECLSDYIFQEYSNGNTHKQSEPTNNMSDCLYMGEPFRKILLKLLPSVEAIVEKFLLPSYSYTRIYRKGDVLRKHTDRRACEFTISLCVSKCSNAPWLFNIERKDKSVIGIDLNPGDFLLIAGRELTHWREELKSDWQVQSFFHYVDYYGEYRDHIWDRNLIF